MDSNHAIVAGSAPTVPASSVADGFPTVITRLLALALARVGDRDEAEDLVQETLIAAWQGGLGTASELDRLLAEQCRGWQARRRALTAALGRLVAGGGSLPPWLAGSEPAAAGSETIVDLALLRITIAERLQQAAGREREPAGARRVGGDGDAAASAVPFLAVPADLAADHPIAAAFVRAGAPVAPATPRPNRGSAAEQYRRTPADREPARAAPSVARRDRLEAQLRERERAAERAARRLDTARRGYDLAATPSSRLAAEAELAAAALGHEQALAARREVARRLADLLLAPDPVAASSRRERRR